MRGPSTVAIAKPPPSRRVPLLSVTVTNYNYGRFLPQNLQSILSQSFTDFELIVIDNASTDDSLDVINHFASADARIRVVVHESNHGALASLHESCDLSRGRYRVHVDGDDFVLSPRAFQLQVSLLESNPRVAQVYSTMTRVDATGSRISASRPYERDMILPGELALEAILGFNLTHSGLMFRLDAYRESGGYPDALPHVDDMLLAVRLCERGDVGYIDQELYAFRQHGTNIHLAPQLRVVQHEILPVIEAAFAGPLGSRLPDGKSVRRRVTRNALVHIPTQYIFSGRIRAGWRLYWESLKARPFQTLVQPRTLSLLSRSVLGHAAHQRLDSLRRRLSRGAEGQCS